MMRSLARLAVVATMSLALRPVVAQADVRSLIAAHPCTIVAVQMLQNVDSSSARAGDFFRFATVNAATIGNTIVIPARTIGYGTVVIAGAAGRNGRAGSLVLEPRYFVFSDGTHLGVVLDHRTADLAANGSSGGAPGYLGAIPVPGIGAAIGIFNYLHNGKNVAVPKGTIFAVFPSDSPSVSRCDR